MNRTIDQVEASALKAEASVTPRTTATARVREVWDLRLRQSERERILEISGFSGAAYGNSNLKWTELSTVEQSRILIGLRDLVTLGNEAAYALGYTRRNG
jgi:hypothetical protein